MTDGDVLPVFIGFDRREERAYQVTRKSLLAHSSIPLHIQRLDLRALEISGLFARKYTPDGAGFIDRADGKRFSTEFSFTRFLVPIMCQWSGPALFCDGDFLWRADVADLLSEFDPAFAVQVVKHDFEPDADSKMRGQAQERYIRKNWSSLVLWNCGHPANRFLTPRETNTKPGNWLHRFMWLEDSQIGELPGGWNWLAGHSTMPDPMAVHFTDGTPDMIPHVEGLPYRDEWWQAANG